MADLNSHTKKIASWVGIISGVIAIITTLSLNIDRWIVTDSELRATEERIINKIEDEAVLTRSIYIAELIERKTRLTDQLDNAQSEGEVAKILRKIQELDHRIEKLRGTAE